MKPELEHIEHIKGNASFVVYNYEAGYFPFKWHYHPEYELTLITCGAGKRLVGDSYEDFLQEDLVLLGPGLPHTWVSEPSGKRVAAVVIQFSETFIQPFLQYAECKNVFSLLKKSKKGLLFKRIHAKDIITTIKRLPDIDELDKLLSLIHILNELSKLSPRILSATVSAYPGSAAAEERINKVSHYIYQHYKRSLQLHDVARLLHLSPGAFCNFFKKATGKTFSDYVNDVRIGKACALLLESDDAIATIACKVGFESLSYFNRVFYNKKSITPGAFRRRLKEHLIL
ncbi:hypothetical protein A8C56_19390 [Niabella ginsenosidivorans]|uniref:HTH araC/xylS-type domain-containing protein n=1 Tax=Niabella ginsenosidivorans TaxID=1176587 RepID=A0A1A9I854_9BACT|nr:AraC family transcriptional regulator [Niabella ginsenosidivorans]ANH82861.1 hypothetical protein A8C56_19390 [Niabella ginsenosidivorans]